MFCAHSQLFPGAIDEGLAQRLVLWNGLEDGPLLSDVANGPLAQPRAAQPEYVPVET